MFGFEKLDVWHLAVGFADDVYRLTRTFPKDELYGLTSQMRRAAVSISANIAEGSSRGSKRDFARFVEIVGGSLMEVVSHASIAHRQNLVSKADYEELYETAERVGLMLSGLRRSLDGRPSGE